MSRSKNKKPFTAVTMRNTLAVVLLITLLAMAGGFYLAHSYLEDVATEVSKIQSDAASSDAKLQYLTSLEGQLSNQTEAIQKAEQIVAESQRYQYQNQIIEDLSSYAAQSGITISGFTFQDSNSASSTPAPAVTTPPAATDSGEEATGQAPAVAAPAQTAKSVNVSVQLGGSVAYVNLLNFIYLIEQNLTQMQISQLNLSPGESPSTVSTQTLDIEVYVK
ncbi:hypothetical protein B7Y94_04100 [Candidatus Saccharibacteria bacterium 32-49-12]|nr:MAG: hypothetical protein B7Y94_04100 [Candidatus Saccharibacteria bacterium 32-49-12]